MKKLKTNLLPTIIVVACSLLIIIFSKNIFESGFVADQYGEAMEYFKGTVTKVLSEDLAPDEYVSGTELGYQKVLVDIKSGPFKNQQVEIINTVSKYNNYKVTEGKKVIVGCYINDENPTMGIYNYDRSSMMYLLISIFLISVILVGGVKGIKSLAALLFTLTCCIFLMIPLMVSGTNPIIASIFTAILSVIVTLTLVSGLNIKTLTAIIGTILGIFVSGALAYIFGNLMDLSGINMSEAENIFFVAQRTELKVHGIMFAGILIASLGAIMDVTMSISSSLFEIYSANNKIPFEKLFLSGMNIGKDIIGTMTNTLILAFAGGSLSILILIFSYYMPYIKLINLDILGVEIIQGITGSIGIVLAVPATALIGSYLLTQKLKSKNN